MERVSTISIDQISGRDSAQTFPRRSSNELRAPTCDLYRNANQQRSSRVPAISNDKSWQGDTCLRYKIVGTGKRLSDQVIKSDEHEFRANETLKQRRVEELLPMERMDRLLAKPISIEQFHPSSQFTSSPLQFLLLSGEQGSKKKTKRIQTRRTRISWNTDLIRTLALLYRISTPLSSPAVLLDKKRGDFNWRRRFFFFFLLRGSKFGRGREMETKKGEKRREWKIVAWLW